MPAFPPINPVFKEVTYRDPVTVYAGLGCKEDSFLLHSARVNISQGRYSFIGFDPFLIFESRGSTITITENGARTSYDGDPTAELRSYLKRYPVKRNPAYPLFQGGAVGYFSYDFCHRYEKLPATTEDDLEVPDSLFLFVDTAILFDHIAERTVVVSTGYPESDSDSREKRAGMRASDLARQVEAVDVCLPDLPQKQHRTPRIRSSFAKDQFEGIVRAAQEYIRAGDIFQVNLAQRLNAPLSLDPLTLYRLLAEINPSPFASYFNFGEISVVSCSPERLVQLEGRSVDTRPIAGTRPRGREEGADQELSQELLLNEKERAEHIMLVDLERNDLGRVCEYGSIHVNELMVLEEYSHVFHIVSNVKGTLRKGLDALDVVRATFPGGTITGTPKIRSMEIIDELETTRRGLYTGSVGYLSFTGDMDLNIVIRTFVIKDGIAYFHVGAGIVADSNPEHEYFETLYKAQALLSTLVY